MVLIDPSAYSWPHSMAQVTDEETKTIYQQLVHWQTHLWQQEWKEKWPGYGPHTLLSDTELDAVAKHARSI